MKRRRKFFQIWLKIIIFYWFFMAKLSKKHKTVYFFIQKQSKLKNTKKTIDARHMIYQKMLSTKLISDQFGRIYCKILIFSPYHHLKVLPSCVCKGNIWQKFGGGGIITPIFDALLLWSICAFWKAPQTVDKAANDVSPEVLTNILSKKSTVMMTQISHK